MHLEINEDAIIWPGGLTQKPTGLMIPTHLKVITIFEKPFVYTRKLNVSSTEVFHNLRQMEAANSQSSYSYSNNNFNKHDVSSSNNKNNHENGMKVSWSDFADLGLDKAKVDSSSTVKPPEMANSDKSGGQGQTASAQSDISKPSRKLPENACDPTYGEVPCPAYNKYWNEDDPGKWHSKQSWTNQGYYNVSNFLRLDIVLKKNVLLKRNVPFFPQLVGKTRPSIIWDWNILVAQGTQTKILRYHAF